MKKCSHCGSSQHSATHHTEKYQLKDKIPDKGFPTSSPKYKTAHEEATKSEKSKFPRKNYNRLKKMDESIPKGELLGKNTRSGTIEVSKKVPTELRSEVAFHEKIENKALRKKK